MKVNGEPYRSIWVDDDGHTVVVIDQTRLPHSFGTRRLGTVEEAANAISTMVVRGAPLIGATAAYGVALALAEDPSDPNLENAIMLLASTRPTAANLRWALEDLGRRLRPLPAEDRAAAAYRRAAELCDEDIAINRAIGEYGLALLEQAAEGKDRTLNVLTHCNAGWLATVDWGTATSPMFQAHDAGVPLHVWVDETRPRNQGALTAWELRSHGIGHSYIVDNAGGHLMQHGLVDMVIVGTDRTTRRGDVCNKIGTYLKALAARDNGVPFYVALPSPTIDWAVEDGLAEIPIEERAPRETTHVLGRTRAGGIEHVQVAPEGTEGGNPAFDVTPNHLVTGLITERGVCDASAEGLAALFPERASDAGGTL
jgi:methylthioribose-1-phosphate isomerase